MKCWSRQEYFPAQQKIDSKLFKDQKIKIREFEHIIAIPDLIDEE